MLHTNLTGNGLTVMIDKSPVIEYMSSLGQKPGKYYIEETRTLYSVLAAECGLSFYLEFYGDDGAARFEFCKDVQGER